VKIACPVCLTANRVPDERLEQGPKCGKCGALLLDGKVLALTRDSFYSFLERTELPVLVDFWAAWCGPCQAMAPVLNRAAEQLNAKVRFAKVDTEAEPVLAQQFNIRSIPTLVRFQAAKEIDRKVGTLDAYRLERWLLQG
jgi:thioredoxin 2